MKNGFMKKILAAMLCVSMTAVPVLPLIPAETVRAETATENGWTNHALGAAATASEEEMSYWGADKAVDGIVNRDETDKPSQSRWSTNGAATFDAVAQKNKVLTLDLGSEKKIDRFVIEWERPNVTSFKIETAKSDKAYSVAYQKSGADEVGTLTSNILLPDTVTAQYVRLTVDGYTAGTINWASVSLYEFKVMEKGEGAVMPDDSAKTLAQVVSELKVKEVASGQPKLELPYVPSGFEVELVGADYEQIIGNDLTVYQPLTDKNVKVIFRVKKGTESKDSGELTVKVAGEKTASTGNAKPKVIPELAEWSGGTGQFTTSGTTKIYIDPAYRSQLSFVAEEFSRDYEDVTGKKIEVQEGKNAGAHDFYLTLDSSDKGLGEEGYRMSVTDKVTVEALNPVGAYWGTRTILQILSQTGDSIVQGTARDYPKYEVRGFMLDVGRKPISKEFLYTVLREMTWYKMSDLQIHLNDNAFVDKYSSTADAMKAYSGFRLESDIKIGGKNKADLTSADMYYTKEEFRQFIQTARKMGVDIVPEFDSPAHSLAFTKVRPDLVFDNSLKGADHLNLHTKYNETYEFVTSVFNEYLEGADPVFDEDTIINVGTDEYDGTYAEAFRKYTDDMLAFIQGKGNTVRLWGSLSQRQGATPVRTKDVQMNLWNTYWADPLSMFNQGFSLINMEDSRLYIVPGSGGTPYKEYLDTGDLYRTWSPNIFRTVTLPSASPKMLGAAFAVWNDNSGILSNGITEQDIYARFAPALPVLACKMWGEGKDLNYNEFTELTGRLGHAPRNNPLYKPEAKDGLYAKYEFEAQDGKADSSANGRNLAQEANVQIKDGQLALGGKGSYVSTPTRKIGLGNTLEFDITLDRPARSGDILFETDSEYWTHDIRIMDDGTLGYTTELYDFSFGYVIPTGKTVHLKITTALERTALYVDGVAYNAVGTYQEADVTTVKGISRSTFVLPAERIGSLENAIHAKIDNVIFSEGISVADGLLDSSKFTVTADSEQSDGPISKAFDKSTGTFWHSSWRPYKALPATVIIDLGKVTSVNKLMYLPRQDGNRNGQIKKYSLYYSPSASGEDWTQVIKSGTWTADASWKAASFAPVQARRLKFVAEDGTGDGNGNFACAAEIQVYEGTANPNGIYVNAFTEDASRGTASVSKHDALKGENVTFKAAAASGYQFEGWYDANGNKVSNAAEYTAAVSSNITLEARFKAVGGSYKLGDINNDGNVDLLDLRIMLRYICNKQELTGSALDAADVHSDGKVDLLDLRKILRYICHKITTLE